MQHMVRHVLAAELERRKSANARYSLRAFAKNLGINPGFLSSVMNGTRTLSLKNLVRVAERLGLGPAETAELLGVSSGLAADVESSSVATIQLDAFQVISDWYHFAILELTHAEVLKNAPEHIARRLGISTATAAQAVARLLRLGLLEVDGKGRLKKTKAFIATPSGTPSRALRGFHAQHLEKAKAALETQAVTERDITGVTIPFDPTRMTEMSAEIRRFRRRMMKLASVGKNTEVYHLSLAFFRLTEPDSKGSRS
mgnify:FL=1